MEDALDDGVKPATRTLTSFTLVKGFPNDAFIVAVAAGYQVWVALASDGRVFTCDTGFDGYGGHLPESVERKGWHKVNQVQPMLHSQCSNICSFHIVIASTQTFASANTTWEFELS